MEGLPRTQHAGLGDRPYEIPHSERQRYASYAHAPKASYVELHAHSAYSFLDGASHPEELAARAAELGYSALALTDHDGLYGSLEFAHAAKAFGVRPITGAEVTLAGGAHVTLLVENARGYANLCKLLTEAHRHTRLPGHATRPMQTPALDQTLLEELNEGLVCLSGCARHGLAVHDPNAAARLEHDFEVAAVDGLFRPPAVDDPPLLPDERHTLTVDTLRRPTRVCFDERRPRVVYSSRATSRARCSGMRDQGATSTTVQTEPPPVLART